MVTQPGSRSAATTLPRSSGSATPTESSPAGGCPQLTAQQCTQTPQFGAESPDPLICVHYCRHAGPPATQQCTQMPQIDRREAHFSHLCTLLRPRGRPRHDSVHKRPKSTRRDSILPSVYTIAAPRGHPQLNSVYKCTQGTAEEPSRVRYIVSPQLPLEECRDLVERDGVLPAPVVEVGVHRARNDHQLLVLGVVASPRHVGKRVLAEVP